MNTTETNGKVCVVWQRKEKVAVSGGTTVLQVDHLFSYVVP